MIPVYEMFGPTIQGEGINVGQRCIFARVAACSYCCSWCDSKYAWDVKGKGVQYFMDTNLAKKLVEKCEEGKCNKVILTGGNPCLYNFTEVIKSLHENNIMVDVETQGDLLPAWLQNCDSIVFSPKAPSSGMPDTYEEITSWVNEKYKSNQQVAIKIPVFNDEDIEFARKYAKFVKEKISADPSISLRFYLSVGNSNVDSKDSIRNEVLENYEKLINKINENPEDFEYCYILPQIHTLVWGNRSGV